MALSGHIIKNVGNWWRLRLEWAATQNVTDNTSTVTCRLYWQSLHSTAAVYSSAPKATVINVNGTKKESTATVGINGNASKLLQTSSFTVSHNADGTGSFTVDAACTLNLTLDGVWVGYTSVGSNAFTLNTIPRASSMSSTADMRAGEYKPFSLSVASSSFFHTVNMYVNGTWIKRVEGVKSSGQFEFSMSDLGNIFTAMGQQKSTTVKFHVTTYNGGSTIGTSEKSGTIYAPDPTSWCPQTSINIGDTLVGNTARPSDYFTYSVGLYTTDGNTLLAWIVSNAIAASLSYNTGDIASTIYDKIPNATYYTAVAKVFTYCNGVQVHGSYNFNIYMYVANSNPTFVNTGVYCYDSDTSVSDLTGSSYHIVQNKSSVVVGVEVASKATAKNGASMSHYVVEFGGLTSNINYSSSENVGTLLDKVNVSGSQTLKVTAVDSRGLRTTVSKTINVIPYTAPKLTVTAKRVNDFENSTTVTINAACSAVSISSANKNSVTLYHYQTRQVGGSWSDTNNITQSGFPNVSNTLTVSLDNSKSWEVYVLIKDAFGSTVTKTVTVGTGKPILFIDSAKKSVGINQQTTGTNMLEVSGGINASGDITSSSVVEAKYFNCEGARFFINDSCGINMRNSDIKNCNAITFADETNSWSEGILFPKKGKTMPSTNPEDYMAIRTQDDILLFNGETLFTPDRTFSLLYTVGGLYMNENQSITVGKQLGACMNGWLLAWSGHDHTSATVLNDQWNFQFIPKTGIRQIATHGSTWLVVANLQWWGTNVRKFLYTNGISITGHEANDDFVDPGDQYGFHDNRRLVLRYVFEY